MMDQVWILFWEFEEEAWIEKTQASSFYSKDGLLKKGAACWINKELENWFDWM